MADPKGRCVQNALMTLITPSHRTYLPLQRYNKFSFLPNFYRKKFSFGSI